MRFPRLPLVLTAACIVNIISSICLVFSNRYLYAIGFNFGPSMSLLHNLVTALVLLSCYRCGCRGILSRSIPKVPRIPQEAPLTSPTTEKHRPRSIPFRALIVLSLAYSLHVVVSNMTLKQTTFRFYQISKIAVTPVVLLLECLLPPVATVALTSQLFSTRSSKKHRHIGFVRKKSSIHALRGLSADEISSAMANPLTQFVYPRDESSSCRTVSWAVFPLCVGALLCAAYDNWGTAAGVGHIASSAAQYSFAPPSEDSKEMQDVAALLKNRSSPEADQKDVKDVEHFRGEKIHSSNASISRSLSNATHPLTEDSSTQEGWDHDEALPLPGNNLLDSFHDTSNLSSVSTIGPSLDGSVVPSRTNMIRNQWEKLKRWSLRARQISVDFYTKWVPSDLTGWMYGFLSVSSNAWFTTMVSRQQRKFNDPPLRLLLAQSGVSSLLLAFFAPLLDDIPNVLSFPHTALSSIILIFSCLFAALVNVSLFLAAAYVSGLSLSVLGFSKLIVELIISAIVTNRVPSLLQLLGSALTVFGLLFYSSLRARSLLAEEDAIAQIISRFPRRLDRAHSLKFDDDTQLHPSSGDEESLSEIPGDEFLGSLQGDAEAPYARITHDVAEIGSSQSISSTRKAQAVRDNDMIDSKRTSRTSEESSRLRHSLDKTGSLDGLAGKFSRSQDMKKRKQQ